MGFFDPPVGFHFNVAFELFPQTPNDFRFKEVSRLGAIEMETVKKAKQSFCPQSATAHRSDLVLKQDCSSVGISVVQEHNKEYDFHQ